MGKHFLLVLAFAAALAGAQAPPVTPSSPQNVAFTTGEPGKVPPGWFVSSPGYSAQLTEEEQSPGKRAVQLEYNEEKSSPGGNLMQTFDAAAYRNKQVRFRAAVRVAGAGSADQAALWLRVDRQPGVIAFFDNMGNRPIRNRDWRYFEIIANIDYDAQKINIGMILQRMGKAWIADASFDVLADLPPVVLEPARPLTARGLRNEIAFSRLFGYVRYFHPSDEGAKTNWEAFAIAGARQVESAKDDAELAQKLTALFEPVGPTVRVLTSGQQYIAPDALGPAGAPGGNSRVTYWKHFGMGPTSGQQSVYHSERVQELASTAAGSKEAPRPASPFKADLVPGVTVWVPLALYVDAQGTLPHSPATPAGNALSPQQLWSANDRGTRLGDVIVAWNVFQHFYPYFDVVKTDWAGELPRALEAAASDNDEAAFTTTLRWLVAALHDGHAAVSKNLGRTGTLPLQWDWVDGGLVITEVGPLAHGMLGQGDVVLQIAGRPVTDALQEAEALISGATPQWIRYRALQDIARGPAGTTINLEVESALDPGKPKTVPLRFETTPPPAERRPDKIAELEKGIFYIDTGRITYADFRNALPDLQNARGIVFDFRGYPGNLQASFLQHLSDKPMASPQWHVPLVLRPDHQDMQFERSGEWGLPPAQPYLTAKKAFITDGRAISYAESCMGFIENYKLGAIVGAPTAGTNGNVNPFTLPGGYSIYWSGMKVLKQDGSQHHGVGIHPTIPVSRTRSGVAAGRDEFLERAVAEVKN